MLGLTGRESILKFAKTDYFSLKIDKCTDNSTTKRLALVIRYKQNFRCKKKF